MGFLIAIFCITIATMVIATIQDLKDNRISIIIFPICLAVCTILNICYINNFTENKTTYIFLLIGGVVIYGVICAILRFFKKIGWADVLMITTLGGCLGWFRITEIMIITCIVAICYIIVKSIKKKSKKKYALAPFLLIGLCVDSIFGLLTQYL